MAQTLRWTRGGKYFEATPEGWQVSAARGADGWHYSAWAPPSDPEMDRLEWLDAHGQVHYPRGTPVPQRVRLLGVFESAEDARAACEAEAAREWASSDDLAACG